MLILAGLALLGFFDKLRVNRVRTRARGETALKIKPVMLTSMSVLATIRAFLILATIVWSLLHRWYKNSRICGPCTGKVQETEIDEHRLKFTFNHH